MNQGRTLFAQWVELLPRLTFLTNHLTLDALTVALLYRKRRRIELFFQWIKQHLHIKAFFDTTPNAARTQVWIAGFFI